MLILKRRIGQSFLIDGRILVKLMATARGSAVIGIQAPVAVPVLREEVLDRPVEEQREPDPGIGAHMAALARWRRGDPPRE